MADEITLSVYHEGHPIFTSTGKWLHPLFELEEFLNTAPCQPATLVVADKIVGKAAALLLVRIGIRRIEAGVLSKLGMSVLERYGVNYSYSQLIERIDCKSEALLATVEDPEQAYRCIRERVGC